MAAGRQDAQGLVDVRTDRLRVDAAEVRVALLVDLVDADPAAREQAADPAGAGAPHRVDEHVEVRRLERIEVDRPADELLVAVERIEPLDEPGRLGVRQRPALDCAAMPLIDSRASTTARISGPAAAPVGAFTLKPLSTHGLWLAVMTMPAAAPRSTTSYELICVGTAWTARKTGMSWASRTSAAASAKCSEANRRS